MRRFAVPLSPSARLGLAGLVLRAGAATAQTLAVNYLPGVPLGPQGVPQLPMAQQTQAWADKAGLKLSWVAVPLQRSVLELQANRTAFCAIGLFVTPQRRRFTRFSLPIALAEQQVLLATATAAAELRQMPNAEAAVRDSRLQLLAFRSVTYGELLDAWIAQRRAPTHWATAGTTPILTLLQRGRADFTISATAEANALQAQVKPGEVAVEIVQLPDMPPPPTRHLGCSHAVPQEWLDRFDAAVRAEPPH